MSCTDHAYFVSASTVHKYFDKLATLVFSTNVGSGLINASKSFF